MRVLESADLIFMSALKLHKIKAFMLICAARVTRGSQGGKTTQNKQNKYEICKNFPHDFESTKREWIVGAIKLNLPLLLHVSKVMITIQEREGNTAEILIHFATMRKTGHNSFKAVFYKNGKDSIY